MSIRIRVSDADEPVTFPTQMAAGRISRDAVPEYDRLIAWLLVAGEGGPFVLAVTSSVSGEGVSTVCADLAMSLARSTSKKIVLVDANLKAPRLHELFGLSSSPGLHEYVVGNEDRQQDAPGRGSTGRGEPSSGEDPAVQGRAARRVLAPLDLHSTGLPNLAVVPGGAATSEHGRLTTSGALKTALQRLRKRCGYVIIDCPPVLSAAETPWLCRLADGVAIVVRAGVTPRDEVKRAQRSLEDAPVIGVVLNGV
ncbi:MAG TPA: CpsD/CapB family tyrosine-protein kinase [Thermoleophilia bacterium]|nr:CpsD/CapB family tyrosine-protein kinase [Thermoleophilia bacterium]